MKWSIELFFLGGNGPISLGCDGLPSDALSVALDYITRASKLPGGKNGKRFCELRIIRMEEDA